MGIFRFLLESLQLVFDDIRSVFVKKRPDAIPTPVVPDKIEPNIPVHPLIDTPEYANIIRREEKPVRNETHVVYNREEKRWDIKKAGSNDVLDYRRLKLDAIKVARGISKEAKSELVIHNRDGKISGKDSHGNDPRSSAG